MSTAITLIAGLVGGNRMLAGVIAWAVIALAASGAAVGAYELIKHQGADELRAQIDKRTRMWPTRALRPAGLFAIGTMLAGCGTSGVSGVPALRSAIGSSLAGAPGQDTRRSEQDRRDDGRRLRSEVLHAGRVRSSDKGQRRAAP